MDDLKKAIEELRQGKKIGYVSQFYGIPERTLRRKKNNSIQTNRPGPKPILTKEAEDDIYQWIIGMQRSGYPVSRDMVLIKGNEVYSKIQDASAESFVETRSDGNSDLETKHLGVGWLNRFLERHPTLSLRTSQAIKRVRDEISVDYVRPFFHSMLKAVIEYRLDASRIYNIDETGFAQKNKSKR